jgi:hypothetical protein
MAKKTVHDLDLSTGEKEADASANPISEEGISEIIRELMDENKRLHAKSILTPKEAQVYGNLEAFSQYHKTPSLLKYVNSQLKLKMSIDGRRVSELISPFGKEVSDTSKKSLKERILNI